jgi:TonB-dependent SusC/RagA subfamily outer membrane receptor
MKKLPSFTFPVVLVLLFLFSCKANQSATQSKDSQPEVIDRGYDHALEKDVTQSSKTMKPNERAPSNLSLADMLRQTSGVTVTGQGNNVSVRVGGVSSFGPSEPLYIVNGTDSGNSYAQVAGMLNTNEIISITVLKGNDAAIYGSRGGNGVIVIRTK